MTDTEEIRYCSFETYRQTRETPAEYCETEVEGDGDYCPDHDDSDLDDEPADFDDYKNGTGRYADDYWLDN